MHSHADFASLISRWTPTVNVGMKIAQKGATIAKEILKGLLTVRFALKATGLIPTEENVTYIPIIPRRSDSKAKSWSAEITKANQRIQNLAWPLAPKSATDATTILF